MLLNNKKKEETQNVVQSNVYILDEEQDIGSARLYTVREYLHEENTTWE